MQASGKGNDNPLQYSRLENSRDGGAWRAAVYGVAQSWTWLKRLSSSSSMQALPERFSKLHKNSIFFLSVEGSDWLIRGKCVWYLEVGVGIFLAICSVHSLVSCMCLISPQQVVWVNAHWWSAFCELQGLQRGWDLAGSNMSRVRGKHTGSGVNWKHWLLDQSRGNHPESGEDQESGGWPLQKTDVPAGGCGSASLRAMYLPPPIPSGPWIPGFPASASCMAAASPRTPSAHTLPPHLPDPGNKVLASWTSLPCTAPITVLHAFFFVSLMQVQLNYNIMLDSGVQHSVSVSLPIILHQKLLQDKGCNPCVVQYILVIYLFCILIKRSMSFLVPYPSLAYLHSLSPQGTTGLFTKARQFLCFLFISFRY